MQFSLRWLFALVAMAALAAAALSYPTSLGAFIAVNVAVVWVFAGTVREA